MIVLIHDELLFTIPNGQVITKEMDLESHRTGIIKVDKWKANNQKINFIGNDIAIDTVVVNIKGEMMKPPIDQHIRYLRIWKNFTNEWKIIAGSSTINN